MNAPFSIWTQYYNTKEPEDAILEFEKDGMTHVELSHEHGSVLLARGEDHRAEGKRFAEFLKNHGITCLQGHLAFPAHLVTDLSFTDYIVRQAELYEAIGIKYAVLHSDYMNGIDISYEERFEKNVEAFTKLAKRTEHIDITFCLENLGGVSKGVDELTETIHRIGSSRFGICLDTGHLNITKTSSQRDFILKAGAYLKALHIADNQGETDQHMMPFGKGTVNFTEVVKALREIGYSGIFNFEIPGETGNCPFSLRHEKIKYLRSVYEYLMSI